VCMAHWERHNQQGHNGEWGAIEGTTKKRGSMTMCQPGIGKGVDREQGKNQPTTAQDYKKKKKSTAMDGEFKKKGGQREKRGTERNPVATKVRKGSCQVDPKDRFGKRQKRKAAMVPSK